MKIYQQCNQLIILFESNSNVHVSVILSKKPYIEYIKKQYPECLLEKEIQFQELNSRLQQQLTDYFKESEAKAIVKNAIFSEAVKQVHT